MRVFNLTPVIATRPLFQRVFRTHSNHKRIAAGALVIGLLTVLAKAFVAGREIAIAWRYGVSVTVDAYQLALTITMWLPMMLMSVMTVVLVPRLVGLEGKPERRQFIAELNGTVLVLGLIVALLTMVAAPSVSLLLASGGDSRTVELTTTMARYMSPVALFSIWIGYLSARLQSRERFAYTVTEAIPAIVIALFIADVVQIGGLAPLVWGTIVGFLFQAVVLSGMVQRNDLGMGSYSLRHRSLEWRSLFASGAIMVIAQTVLALSIPIDQAFAARIGEGAVATLGYANRIAILITGFATVVLARALLPVLSRTIAEGERTLAARQARQWAGLLFVFGALAAFVVWFLAEWGVGIAFERGAFTHDDTEAVASVLQFAALQLPFYFAGLALVQLYAAAGRFTALLMITSCGLAVKIGANAAFVPFVGIEGLMLSTTFMYLTTFVLLLSGISQFGRSTVRRP